MDIGRVYYLIQNIDPLEKYCKSSWASFTFACKVHGLYFDKGLTYRLWQNV